LVAGWVKRPFRRGDDMDFTGILSGGVCMKLLWCAVLIVAAGPVVAQEKPKETAPKLPGQWKVTWGADRGNAVSTVFDIHWTVAENSKVIVTYGSDPKSNIVDEFSMILDPAKGTLDRKRGEEATLGLFRMDNDDTLIVCFNYSTKDRPTSIESNPAYGYTVYKLQRVKPK
jgi:uncharacterized protein (TIGR03067 family)